MIFSGWSTFDIAGASFLREDGSPFGEGRASGLHLGDIIHAAKVAAGEKVTEVEGDQPNVRTHEGFLWEAAQEYMQAGLGLDESMDLAFKRYGMQLRGGVLKQIRVTLDDIHMTPDGLDPVLRRTESMKATRRTLRRALTQEDFEDNFWTWVMQEAGYLHGIRRTMPEYADIDTVRWIVLWSAGDYSKGAGSGPRVMEATAQFTQDELLANWNRVLSIAERLRRRSDVPKQ